MLGTLRKILQRGDRPFLDPDAETALLLEAGIDDIKSPVDPGDLAFTAPVLAQAQPSELRWSPSGFEPDRSLPFDSDEERQFFDLVQDTHGGGVARWLHPQVPLDLLLSGLGVEASGDRRVDFLFSAPAGTPSVIEVDGAQHARQEAVDEDRDSSLAAAGIQVLRVPASEVRAGAGPGLEAALAAIGQNGIGESGSRDEQVLAFAPWVGTALGLALVEGVERGFLPQAGTWSLRVTEPLGVTQLVLPSLLDLFGAVDELWAGYIAPERVVVEAGDQTFAFERTGVGSYTTSSGPATQDAQLQIHLEPQLSAQDVLPKGDGPRIIMRGSTLPVRVADRRSEGSLLGRPRDHDAVGDALSRILRFVFAKKEFRPGQETAIRRVLAGEDAVVLLPTGAGKSLIYQLAGLILPGRTIIVDPIVALIEDQKRVLERYGVDRAVGLSQFVTSHGLMEDGLRMVANGDALFFFISPERLQRQGFREALRQLTTTVPINLAVIDEAHCISEWGHDFRPSYLNLGETLRTWCASPSGDAPPLLALTGTASRSVLNDVVAELGIDRVSDNAVIRPDTFGREELSFEIFRSRSDDDALQRLIGLVRSLPQRFGVPESRFFAPPGRSDMLGLVFCPHVNGDRGIIGVAEALTAAGLLSDVAIYSGSTAPRGRMRESWDLEKREHEQRFRTGERSVLVATKAFGMGIDLPNIRYTIHYGIPGSIEAFYQEAGRAGRDRADAACFLVLCDVDPARNRDLLSENLPEEEARSQHEAIDGWDNRDDINRQLWFHFNSFQGREHELAVVQGVLADLDWEGDRGFIEIPLQPQKDREQAIVRLRNIGAIADYTVGSNFRLEMTRAAPESLADGFLSYVERSHPGRLEDISRRVGAVATSGSIRDYAGQLCGLAIDLAYDTIERARRRSLREVWLLASNADSDKEIRARIEDYFREGELAPVFDRLIELEKVDLGEWWAVLRQRGATDAGEMRGLAARYLESYPDHPGLLIARSVAEVIAGGDLDEAEDSLRQSMQTSVDSYSLDVEHVLVGMSQALALFRRVRPEEAWRVWSAWESADLEGQLEADGIDALAGMEREALARSRSPEEGAILLARALRRSASHTRTIERELVGEGMGG